MLLAALTAFAPLSIDMYLPSLPTLVQVFATDTGRVQLTLSAFLIGFGIGHLIYGPLSDRYGRRLPLLVGVLLYVLASGWCALSENIEVMIALRFLQGMTACAGPVIVRAMIRDRFNPEQGAQMLSLVFMVMTLAPLLAPLLGGWILI
ncbi:MAG: MFS transporter, partial [Candidatus Competibacteraceae bacterium]|nr:MFS transporter [Candidatus Competibacteraceae bacterium]